MSDAPIGLISSAASEVLLQERRTVQVATPFGAAELLTGRIAGHEAVVVLRYGPGLTIPSHRINYRANIWGLRELGVRNVISQNAIGSVNMAIRPGDIVISDDVLDRTKNRVLSLFEDSDCWVRVDMTEPFCPRLRGALIEAASRHSERVISRGVFVCTEGPRFETPAEIRALRLEGGDIVGTPLIPEVVMAREAELCFASIAPVINFGAGMAPAVVHFGSGSMNENYYTGGLHDLVERTLIDVVGLVRTLPLHGCGCRTALRGGFHGTKPEWLIGSSLDPAS